MPAADKNKNTIAWATVAGGLIVAILGAIVVNFVILPIRDKMKERDALKLEVHDLGLRVQAIEVWQKEMTRWKERMIAATGVTDIRREMRTMPAPHPVDTLQSNPH